MFAKQRRTVNRRNCPTWMFQSAQERIYFALLLPVVKVYEWMNLNECEDDRVTTEIIYNDCEEANHSKNE